MNIIIYLHRKMLIQFDNTEFTLGDPRFEFCPRLSLPKSSQSGSGLCCLFRKDFVRRPAVPRLKANSLMLNKNKIKSRMM